MGKGTGVGIRTGRGGQLGGECASGTQWGIWEGAERGLGKGIVRVREDREGRDSSGEGEACRIGVRRKGTVKEKRR